MTRINQRCVGSTTMWAVLLFSCVCLLGGLLLKSYSDKETGHGKGVVPIDQYKQMISHCVEDIVDLTDWFEKQVWYTMAVLPPSPDLILMQSGYPSVLPFKASSFPAKFNEGLVAHIEYSVPVYPITVIRDPLTLEIAFFNANGKEFYSMKPEGGYDPLEFLKNWKPTLYGGAFPTDWIRYQESIYNPSRIQVTSKLISFNSVEHYLYAKYATSCATSLDTEQVYESTSLMRAGSSYSNGHWISAVWDNNEEASNLCLTVHLISGDTNSIDIFACTNLHTPQWVLAVTNLASVASNTIPWVDTNMTEYTRRYYWAAKCTDSDGDALSDAFEHLIFGTSEYCEDTDGDALPDNIDAYPCNYDTNTLSFIITNPTNGMVLP
ncbi:MAG: hypothetical protein EOM20_05135 [Spartobacteria bacterium]|nr:hypothetical protein [Spartobacteria bacterium]